MREAVARRCTSIYDVVATYLDENGLGTDLLVRLGVNGLFSAQPHELLRGGEGT